MSYPELKGGCISFVVLRACGFWQRARSTTKETRHDEKIIRPTGNAVPAISLVTLFHRIPYAGQRDGCRGLRAGSLPAVVCLGTGKNHRPSQSLSLHAGDAQVY